MNTLKNYLLDIVTNITIKLKRLERFIAYRTYDRYNLINIKSLVPDYYDKDTIMLHGMFQLLVDFVEVEIAHRQHWINLYNKKDENLTSYLEYRFKDRLPKEKARELGLQYINFYKNFTLEESEERSELNIKFEQGQVQFGNDLYNLYIWWKDIRPSRPDSMDESGLHDFYQKNRDKMHKFIKLDNGLFEMKNLLTEEEEEEYGKLLHLSVSLDEQYEKEDEDMLIKLIKLRRSLWT